jgi:hypothetical protein
MELRQAKMIIALYQEAIQDESPELVPMALRFAIDRCALKGIND